MTKWACPECDGGFPDPIEWQNKYVCPWCYEEIGRHHNSNASVEELVGPVELVSARIDDGEQSESPLRRLLT